MTAKKNYQFKTEIEQLLDILANSLYTNKEIFLRELVSNASDALNKIRFLSLTKPDLLGKDSDLKIYIRVDEKAKTIEIEDNGIGMTQEDLQNNLGTIAKSGTANFVKALKQTKDVEQIGKFGVGFYSVFMVTEKVTLETLNYKSKQAFRWISEGKDSYTIEPIEKKNRGTKIIFTLKKEAEDFATPFRLENIIQKYSNFVSFPIMLNGEQKNQPDAIWRKSKSQVKEADYNKFFQYLSGTQGEPLLTIHFNIEAPVQFSALLFVAKDKDANPFHPEQQELNRLHLYIKKVFIQDDCKGLAPHWLRFIYGVVDTEDLPLNISREVTQDSPVIMKTKQLLVKKVLTELEKLANKDKETFFQLWENFSSFIKDGIYNDFENKDKLLEIYHLHSSKSPDKFVALKDIVSRLDKDTKELYYIYGKSAAIIESNPNIEYFIKKGIEVLYLYQEIDDFILPTIGSYKDVKLVPIDRAKLDKESSETKEEEKKTSPEQTDLLNFIQDLLKDKVAKVVSSKRLVDSPCTLVSADDAMNASMEKMMQMMQKDFQKSKKILEINLDNPLIKQLKEIKTIEPQDDLIKDSVLQLYDNAELISAADEQTNLMIARINKLLQSHLSLRLKELKSNSQK